MVTVAQHITDEDGPVAGPVPLLPLLPAKLARPRMRPGVDRSRLFAALDAAAGSPVTVVCAGAGWGKTMAVSGWAQQRHRPVAWLNADRHDNDPQVFWAYLLAALRVAGAVPADNPLAGLGSVFFLIYNGLVIGSVMGPIEPMGYQQNFYPFVIGHGAFELTAIVLAGAAGLRLGLALLAPGRRGPRAAVHGGEGRGGRAPP